MVHRANRQQMRVSLKKTMRKVRRLDSRRARTTVARMVERSYLLERFDRDDVLNWTFTTMLHINSTIALLYK